MPSSVLGTLHPLHWCSTNLLPRALRLGQGCFRNKPGSAGPDLMQCGAVQVRDYLFAQPELNLTDADNAGVASNTLFMVELLLPPKADALAALDDAGPRPPRQVLTSPQTLADRP